MSVLVFELASAEAVEEFLFTSYCDDLVWGREGLHALDFSSATFGGLILNEVSERLDLAFDFLIVLSEVV